MPMFAPGAALEEFRQFLASRGLDEVTLSVRDGFEAMLDFYRDVRASGCVFGDADMLLFQWGTYDRALLPRGGGSGEAFDLNLTRQLIFSEGGEDDDIWQLTLNFDFEPTDRLRALGNSNSWCHAVHDLPQFRQHVLASAPVTACSQLQIRGTTLEYGCAG